MRIAFTIALKDMKEIFHQRSTYIYIAFMFLISYPYLAGSRAGIGQLTGQGASRAQIEDTARSFLGIAIYTLPLTLTMLFCTYLSAYAIVLEKSKRTLESLLATPASLRQMWYGKSLAVAIPSIIVTFLVLAVAVVALNLGVISPKTGTFVMPAPLPLITAIVLVPLVTFGVVTLVSLLQLVLSNPRIANFAFIAVFFGFYIVTVTQASKGWDFSLIYLATAVVLALANLIFGRLLTKERVVLSSKGIA